MSAPQIVGLVTGIGILVVLFESLRRHRLRERYALLWSLLGVLAVVIGVFPTILTSVTQGLGLQIPANLLFFATTLVLFGLSLQHSFELTQAEEHLRTLAEELALARLEIDQLRAEMDAAPRDARPLLPASE